MHLPSFLLSLLTLSCTLFFLAAADDIRVEIRVLDFSNKARVLADGVTKCKPNRCEADQPPCDVRIERAMNKSVCPQDSEKCFTSTTADPKSVNYESFYYYQCVDPGTLNHTFTQDTCNEKFKKINLPVHAYHAQYYVNPAPDIQYFDCYTSGNAADVAANQNAAKWSKVMSCDQKFKNPANAKLTYQWRAYHVPKEQCGADARKAVAEKAEEAAQEAKEAAAAAAKKAAKEAEQQKIKQQDEEAKKRGLAKLLVSLHVIVRTVPADSNDQEKITRSALLDLFSKNFGKRYRTENVTIQLASHDRERKYYFIVGYSVPVDEKTISNEFVNLIKRSKIPNVVDACFESKDCKTK
ncbi:uncharacterized protein LOC129599402 [Paramacrobiotus metropolitanus]|uniref:uncharacterized protein LOC129599402 n=1 Tax=Paramacrobiotus metropolitanus TaxID=2943436 RepID=UPI0024461BFA|nr:uncharacterized protein LOC129599402 [Paramacrobiotus metropolitanus]